MSQTDSNRDGAIDPTEAKDTWLESGFAKLDADRDGRLGRADLDKAFFQDSAVQAQGVGAGVAVGAGLLGVGLAGYLSYAGMVGSHDMMFPPRDTFHRDPGAYGVQFGRGDAGPDCLFQRIQRLPHHRGNAPDPQQVFFVLDGHGG